jgi:hypothetical protein
MTATHDIHRALRNLVVADIVEYAKESPAALEQALAEIRYRTEKRPKKRSVAALRRLERLRDHQLAQQVAGEKPA